MFGLPTAPSGDASPAGKRVGKTKTAARRITKGFFMVAGI
jgi:hypothetical protein